MTQKNLAALGAGILCPVEMPLPVVLASASPRRKELLADLIPNFEVIASSVAEEEFVAPTPPETAELLALEKARAVASKRPDSIVIGADTVVHQNGRIFDKPANSEVAAATLRSLSGGRHTVTTGVCIVAPNSEFKFSVSTEVWFAALTQAEIEAYVATGEPMDKAGAYAIQGGAAPFVQKIEGSLSNVVGLPMEELGAALSVVGSRLEKGRRTKVGEPRRRNEEGA